jgi:hypothetical protein
MRTKSMFTALALVLLLSTFCHAGGPLVVGGPALGTRPAFGTDGVAFTWNPAAMPIQYRVDPGPMATTASGAVVISNATGLQRVRSMFNVWQSVPTATVSFNNAGPILPTGAYTGGDVSTIAQFDAITASCNAGTQNPVIFDSNGSLLAALGLSPNIIGFNSGCSVDPSTGFIKSSFILLNGEFQDGVTQTSGARPNFELTANEFDEAITHEMGHFLGLDHSQINLDLFTNVNAFTNPCDIDGLAGMPLMFPFSFCQARKDAGLPVLSPDDVSWISSMYPNAAEAAAYGTITGAVFFPDGESQFQGANVIARQVDDPSTLEDESRRIAVSVVSGYLITGNPGQSITAVLGGSEDNTNGDPNGSRKPGLIGFYQVKVPPGTYTIEVETIDPSFTAGSGLGPLRVSVGVGSKFWNKDETAFDFPLERDSVTVGAGETISNIDIILNGTLPRFDANEDSSALIDAPFRLLSAGKEGGRA